MFRFRLLFIIFISFIIFSCATVPITGRQQLSIIPSSQLNSMSLAQYNDFLKNHKVIKSGRQAALVKRTGRNIQKAVEKYFAEQNMSAFLNDYHWEFNLVEDAKENAWCMPGGKVVVYTGILPIVKNETGLAVVMGHEIAHAIAGHGGERMSQGLLVQMGGIALNEAIKTKPAETQGLFMTAFGLGSQYGVMLPFSRMHESEADHMGLIFMAMAGYNPEKAVDFWQRMASMKGGQAPPELLSTHPSDETRIKEIKKHLPKALKYYKK